MVSRTILAMPIKPNSPMHATPDVIIIGAGITGLFLAHHLLNKNIKLNIVIYDQGELGHGASSKNAGFLTMGSYSFLKKVSALDNAKELLDIISKSISGVKKFSLASLVELGSQTHLLRPDDDFSFVQKKLKSSNIYLTQKGNILSNPHDCGINPNELLQKLYKSIEERVHFFFNHHLSNTEQFEAKHVLIATNTPPTFLNIKKSIKPVRAQIAKFSVQRKNSPNIYIPDQRIYYRFYNNELIIGGQRLLDAETEETNKEGLNSIIQKALAQKALDLSHGEAKLIKSWSGIMSFTEDELPIQHQQENLTFIGGFSGHGNAFSFELTRRLIQSLDL
jgi:gamma-glutamylputrescine oxidase